MSSRNPFTHCLSNETKQVRCWLLDDEAGSVRDLGDEIQDK